MAQGIMNEGHTTRRSSFAVLQGSTYGGPRTENDYSYSFQSYFLISPAAPRMSDTYTIQTIVDYIPLYSFIFEITDFRVKRLWNQPRMTVKELRKTKLLLETRLFQRRRPPPNRRDQVRPMALTIPSMFKRR